MRTREEQISALSFEIDGVQAKASTKRYVEQHLLEAERRAEQRVRAEIANQEEHRLSKHGNAYANAARENNND